MQGEILLAATEVSRRFGGLLAVDRASLALVGGEVHALIGTNGAGKSTLVNVLSGEIAADGGRVYLAGRDVTRFIALSSGKGRSTPNNRITSPARAPAAFKVTRALTSNERLLSRSRTLIPAILPLSRTASVAST